MFNASSQTERSLVGLNANFSVVGLIKSAITLSLKVSHVLQLTQMLVFVMLYFS